MDNAVSSIDDLRLTEIKKGYELRSKVNKITNGLKLYEKISVIFLLCDTPQTGILIMDEILQSQDHSSQNNIFYKWLKECLSTIEDWQNALAELLCIIQNYKLAKILNYTKEQLIEKFEPKNNLKSHLISIIRKILYNLCEDLNSNESKTLITLFGDSVNHFKNKYLEYKLLEWSENGIIYLGNEKPIDLIILIENLKKNYKKNEFVSDLEIVVEKTNCQSVRNKYLLKSEMSEYYEIIDKNYLGLCVIINEKNFSSNIFPKRLGTDKDAERLFEVFTAFGFNVKIHVDLSFKQLIDTLSLYAKTIDKTSSFFVLIILSHGSENVIYTSDSEPIDMNTIEMIFQAEFCPNLLGKPKIFIIQSCQGEKWQRVILDDDLNLETDHAMPGNRTSVSGIGPQRGDSMIAWSTVQGFASFRDKYNGSWYIQELCDQLWKFGDAMDLVEILTRVNNNLRNKVYGGQFMVPSLLLSLRAKIQFVKLEENFQKSRKIMFERLIFDKYFKEFLINSKSPHLKHLFKT